MYETSYSGRVLDQLRELVLRNPTRAAEILVAVREIDRRLRIYPQFGQPLHDLSVSRAQQWLAVVPPLIVRYVIVEADENGQGRQVLVVRPFTALPHTSIV